MQWQGPIGIGMPSVVKKGRVRSAANSEIPLLLLPLSFLEASHASWKLPGSSLECNAHFHKRNVPHARYKTRPGVPLQFVHYMLNDVLHRRTDVSYPIRKETHGRIRCG